MKHLPFLPTPITKLPNSSKELGCNLLCKRDDLFMDAGGGNKARMLQYLLYKLTEEKFDVVVTAGPKSSNFNRACALMCAKFGVAMHLVLYSSDDEQDETSLNSKLCELTGVTFTRCKKTDVPQTIQNVIASYGNRKVLSIYGGGRSLEGIYAYYEAVEELAQQVEHIDHLFVACGTGTTLTGLCAGMQKHFPHAQVHAISISREYADEHVVMEEDMQWLNTYLDANYNFASLHYSDAYLFGGYAVYNDELTTAIQKAISQEGILLDPCYTGKAWYGMLHIIRQNPEQYKGKNILFWHTGGMFNLLSML